MTAAPTQRRGFERIDACLPLGGSAGFGGTTFFAVAPGGGGGCHVPPFFQRSATAFVKHDGGLPPETNPAGQPH